MGRFKNFALLAISATFVAAGLWLLFGPKGDQEQARVGLTTILFFGGCGAVGLAEARTSSGLDAARARRATEPDSAAFMLNASRLAPMALGSLLMGAGGALMGPLGAPGWLASLCGLLFGGGGVFLALMTLDRRAYVVVDGEGLFDRRLFEDKARWDEIAAISFDGSWGVPSIELHLADGVTLPRSTPPFHRFFGLKPPARLRVAATQLDGGLDEILAAIHRFRPETMVRGYDDH